jgi:hypothetical protein
VAELGSLIDAKTSLPFVWRMAQWVWWLVVVRVTRVVLALTTGSHSDITATDQIRPIATMAAIPITVRICVSSGSR